jgi:hypothetical protein
MFTSHIAVSHSKGSNIRPDDLPSFKPLPESLLPRDEGGGFRGVTPASGSFVAECNTKPCHLHQYLGSFSTAQEASQHFMHHMLTAHPEEDPAEWGTGERQRSRGTREEDPAEWVQPIGDPAAFGGGSNEDTLKRKRQVGQKDEGGPGCKSGGGGRTKAQPGEPSPQGLKRKAAPAAPAAETLDLSPEPEPIPDDLLMLCQSGEVQGENHLSLSLSLYVCPQLTVKFN